MVTKVVYQPDTTVTDVFLILIQDVGAAERYIKGDTTIPLVEFLDSFDVFHSAQGPQGILARPSKQELESSFGTTKEDEVIAIILSKGTLQTTDVPIKVSGGNSKSTANQTSRGAVGGGR